MDKKLYVPTDRDATHVAGTRYRGRPVGLTASQAEHELRVGAIKPFTEKAEAKTSTGGKKS